MKYMNINKWGLKNIYYALFALVILSYLDKELKWNIITQNFQDFTFWLAEKFRFFSLTITLHIKSYCLLLFVPILIFSSFPLPSYYHKYPT